MVGRAVRLRRRGVGYVSEAERQDVFDDQIVGVAGAQARVVDDQGEPDLVPQLDHREGLDRLCDGEVRFDYADLTRLVGARMADARPVEPAVRGRVVADDPAVLVCRDVRNDRVEGDHDVSVIRVVEGAKRPVDVDRRGAVVRVAHRLRRGEDGSELV